MVWVELIKLIQVGVFMIRRIEEKDLETINSWYKARRNWQVPPNDIFPETGYIVEKEGVGYYAMWLYLSNSNIAVIDWVVSNPKVKDRELLSKLLKYVCEEVHRFGYKYAMSIFDNNLILEKEFAKLGFIQGSQCFNYIKRI
jgi:hypothetical protein